jgi:hypothetical protein
MNFDRRSGSEFSDLRPETQKRHHTNLTALQLHIQGTVGADVGSACVTFGDASGLGAFVEYTELHIIGLAE